MTLARPATLALLLAATSGCAAAAPQQPSSNPEAHQVTRSAVDCRSAQVDASNEGSTGSVADPSVSHPTSPGCPAAGRRLALEGEHDSISLPAGRWVVVATAPAHRFVTLGISGPADALQLFEVAAPRGLDRLRTGSRDDDGKLPAFVSFETEDRELEVAAIVDVRAPVQLIQVASDADDIGERTAADLRLGKAAPRPLVGMPFPVESRAGYLLQTPPRYLFVRSDVAVALRGALHQTRVRFRKGSLALGDASQWDGQRPATDLERPRHISHEGGRDIDIGLPANDGSASLLRRRCEGVLVEQDRLECAPGTVQGLDALKLAYFLGLLIDGPTPGGRYIANPDRRPGPTAVVETIFTDQAYIDQIRKALGELRRKKWIHDEAYGALGEEGLLRPSPWHVDHVHVRFQGEPALVPKGLEFAPTPGSEEEEPLEETPVSE